MMRRGFCRGGMRATLLLMALGGGVTQAAGAQAGAVLSGTVRDRSGVALGGVVVRAGAAQTRTDRLGGYTLRLPAGETRVEVQPGGGGAATLSVSVDVEADQTLDLAVGEESVSVVAGRDAANPDPATVGYTKAELLEANPGRPGVPVSIPGAPVETASGGIKAPQYFAPGVAGDHGEPIAQFVAVGGFLFQNNLTANAHGNGYADPNFVVPATVSGALVDNAGYNARYGDHSINLAVTYELADRVPRFVQGATDGRDGVVSAGWSPRDDRRRAWVVAEGLWGNGYLARAEERQQYRVNALRGWETGRHEVTAYGVGYYGFSRIPGLIPLEAPVVNDTLDPRQADLTHTALGVVADRWQISDRESLTSGGFFRTYSLALRSNFGDGLIRQSEFRTVVGGGTLSSRAVTERVTLLAGMDARRDAPRNLDLAHADGNGVFGLVTANDLTLWTIAPYAAVNAAVRPWLVVYAGVRRDQVRFENVDLLVAENSFTKWPGVTSPKVNVTLGRGDAPVLPQVSFSWGKAFHANDPRIGTGTPGGSLLIQAREMQATAYKSVAGTELRLTVARVANSLELAKIDPDTGLPQDVGPSLNRFLTVSARRRFGWGFAQGTWSEADARDRLLGSPVPEAPRMIVDGVAGVNRLPWGMRGQVEFEYVKAKPLGDGFTGRPVAEVRLALARSFRDGRWVASLYGEVNSGFTGQTLETVALPGEAAATERIAGVPTRSFGGGSVRWVFDR